MEPSKKMSSIVKQHRKKVSTDFYTKISTDEDG